MTQALALYSGSMAVTSMPDAVDFCRTAFQEVGIKQQNLSKVKVPSGGMQAFTVAELGGDSYVETIDVIIAYARPNQRAWYQTLFEESGGGSRPDCSSEDGVTGYGIREIGAPEDTEKTTCACAACPWNEWESKRGSTPSKGKDCAEMVYLYFFTGEQLLPLLMVVPPTSIGEYKDYAINLMKFGRRVNTVVTTISLITEESDGGIPYSKLAFSMGGNLSAEHQERMGELATLTRENFAEFNPLDVPAEQAPDGDLDPSTDDREALDA